MAEANGMETVSHNLGKLTVFALIRLFDSRKSVIEYVAYVQDKIWNAFHSVTGSEEEWRFSPKYDISENLKQITASLQKEVEAVRRQEKLFEGFVLNYNGSPLGTVQWETYDRAGLKAALDEIIKEEDAIFDNLKAMRDKLQKYNAEKSSQWLIGRRVLLFEWHCLTESERERG